MCWIQQGLGAQKGWRAIHAEVVSADSGFGALQCKQDPNVPGLRLSRP